MSANKKANIKFTDLSYRSDVKLINDDLSKIEESNNNSYYKDYDYKYNNNNNKEFKEEDISDSDNSIYNSLEGNNIEEDDQSNDISNNKIEQISNSKEKALIKKDNINNNNYINNEIHQNFEFFKEKINYEISKLKDDYNSYIAELSNLRKEILEEKNKLSPDLLIYPDIIDKYYTSLKHCELSELDNFQIYKNSREIIQHLKVIKIIN